MTWCLQCGVEHHPVAAVGQDEEGEPACAAHAVKKGEGMDLKDAPKCKAPDCEVHTKSKVGYCAKHYFLSKTKNQGTPPSCSVCGETLRRNNATRLCKKHRGSAGHGKTTAKPARKSKANGTNGHAAAPQLQGGKWVDLEALRVSLQRKLDVLSQVEQMLSDAARSGASQ